MTLDNNNCYSCSITKINIAIDKSVGDTDSKEANLSWMPYKDYKIINKNYMKMLGWCNGGSNYLLTHFSHVTSFCLSAILTGKKDALADVLKSLLGVSKQTGFSGTVCAE